MGVSKKLIYFILFFISPFYVTANVEKAWSLMRKSRGSVRNYPRIVKHLTDSGFYYSSIPYIKEYLTRNRGTRSGTIDALIDKVVTKVGVKQFEVLPTEFLQRSNAPMLRYILAKKYFRKGQYNQALSSLRGRIDFSHPSRPFSLHLEATILSIKRQYDEAREKFQDCVSSSKKFEGRYNDATRKKQLRINRDSCIAGIARNYFASRQFKKANLAYLDIEKSSPIWPDILFEEAWNSFYQKDYNRTLGKLVTYKVPILDYIYNPEIDVLRAMSYMELCLWEDTKKVVDDFYAKYQNNISSVKRILTKNRRSLKKFYHMAKEGRSVATGNELLDSIIRSLSRDSAYQELNASFENGKKEIEKVSRLRNSGLKNILMRNLKDSMLLQRNLMGAYVRKVLQNGSRSIGKMFEGMSYIKLEVLSRRKTKLYGEVEGTGRSRGKFKYLTRNDKQYFWTFNGEFWADELGDYVFGLKSEC